MPLTQGKARSTGTRNGLYEQVVENLVKFYLSISKEEQAQRILERKTNPLKRWKLSPIDQQAQDRWDAYSDAKEETLRRTASVAAPWTIVKADDKLRARLNIARFVLNRFEYEGKDREAIGDVDPLLVADAASIYPSADNSSADNPSAEIPRSS